MGCDFVEAHAARRTSKNRIMPSRVHGVLPWCSVDANAVREEALKAQHRLVTVTGTSGAAIAYDYKPCQSVAVREVSVGGRRDCRAIARTGTTLFVAVAGGGLAVLDIADPRASQIVGTLALPGSELVDLVLVGTMLYAADYHAGVHAIDVSDRARPRHHAHHAALGVAQNRRVVAADNLLVLVSDHAFAVFDISKPGTLAPAGAHARMRAAAGWLRGVVLERARLHLTQGVTGAWTFDLADPRTPRPVAGQEPRLDTRPNERLICDALASHDGRLFVGTSSGIWVLRLPESGPPESEAFFTGPGTIRDTARGVVRGGALHFCSCEPHDHVMHIFDASEGIRYMGRQRLSRMIERIHGLELGDDCWIAAAGNAGVLFASY